MTRVHFVRTSLLAATILAAGTFSVSPALAQNAGDNLNSIESEIKDLQKELKRLKQQLADQAKAKAAEAQKARAAATAAPVAPYAAPNLAQASPPTLVPQQLPPTIAPPPAVGTSVNPTPPAAFSDEYPITTVPPPPGSDSLYSASPAILTQLAPGYSLRIGGLTVTLGGYVEAASIYRNHNETAGVGSNFNTAVPMANNPNYYIGEFRMDARQSRWAALAQGNISNSISVAAYLEGDFLSAAPTANSIESSSYNPRWRLYYAQIDDSDLGLHALVGEGWSLATMFKTGMVPRQELIPIDPEAQYIVGFTWTRNMEYRLVKSFDDNRWNVGLSLENPASNWYVGPNGTGVPGTTYYQFPGGPLYFSGTNYSFDAAPDVILKTTYDPGFGHYELYGLGRWLRDRTTIGTGGNNHITPAGGVGGGVLYSFFDQWLDVYSTFLAGYGIGRYTTAGLPDATVGRDGSPAPIPGAQLLIGAIAHPSDAVDAYLYFGTEQERATAFTNAGKGYGYGSALYSNAGCDIQSNPVCTANTSGVTEGSVGFWWRFLEGKNVGVFLAGPQYQYIRRATFAGVGGAPKVNEQIWMFSMRYYPFQ